MIMSKVISRTKYEYYEYVTAAILSIGMVFFMLDTGSERQKGINFLSIFQIIPNQHT